VEKYPKYPKSPKIAQVAKFIQIVKHFSQIRFRIVLETINAKRGVNVVNLKNIFSPKKWAILAKITAI
jgi:hypothetical protein